MQPTEGYNQPRRTLDVEDYIDILRRHKGWIFGPFLLVLVASVVGVYLWPDSYESTATISIRPPQISANLIRGATQIDIVDRINQLSNQVMSRVELSNMIRNLNLYPRERTSLPTEDVLELMRSKIRIDAAPAIVGGRSVPAFRISFTYANRFDATKVVNNLVSHFLDENIKNRGTTTYQQEDFIKSQVEQTKKRLDDAEAKVTAFRLSHPGALPDQMASNLQQMQSVQANVFALTNSISRANSDKLQLEQQIRNYQSQIAGLERDSKVVPLPVVRVARNPKIGQVEQELETMRQNMTAMRKSFTENYPQVKQLKSFIDIKQEQLDRLLAEEAAKPVEAPPAPTENIAVTRDVRNYNISITSTQSLIQAKDAEIAAYERQAKMANEQLSMLNSRVSAMPVGDQEFAELMREQRLANEEYLRQSQNLNDARIQVDMESRKQGESLEVLDPASQATEPTEPNRPMVISVGAGLGFMLGIVLAGAREMKDTSLKNLKDVRAYTQMAILGSVPLLENDFVVRRRRRIAWLSWTVACLSAALIMAGSVVYYYATKP
jgi:polysaccharide chain length determinant protein (PEP-CTERM system associated)